MNNSHQPSTYKHEYKHSISLNDHPMRCDLCSRKIDRRFRTIHFSAGAGHNSHMRLLIRVRSKMRDALCPPAALPSTPSKRPAATRLEKAICPIRPRSRKFGNFRHYRRDHRTKKRFNRDQYFLVGVRGFEPPTPASRTQYSTRLSYTPNMWTRRQSLGFA